MRLGGASLAWSDPEGCRRTWARSSRGSLLRWESVELTPHADAAQARLWAILAGWRADVGRLSEADLEAVGLSQFPDGLDPKVPFTAGGPTARASIAPPRSAYCGTSGQRVDPPGGAV